MKDLTLIGPFNQLLTMDHLPARGPLNDDQLEIIEHAGILMSDKTIEAIGSFRDLSTLADNFDRIVGPCTAIPGLTDVHTHICWAGNRAKDYAMRLSGKTYQDIARQGGGIQHTVTGTREATLEDLREITAGRASNMLQDGITTIEVKSGYGLDIDSEIKMLTAIQQAADKTTADLVPTCLAAHIKPFDFEGSSGEYLNFLLQELLPIVKDRKLASRVDIYVDEGAFSVEDARAYLKAAKKSGFDIIVHADQFTTGGLQLAVETGALSADHLEVITDKDIQTMAKSSVIPVVLPGSSLGLGIPFAPARKMLDAGSSLVISSDYNPGSAPMGKLMTQAALMGIYEKLTMAETLAAITCRAPQALRLNDRGILRPGMLADFIVFPCDDYRDILYHQGAMAPVKVWKRGRMVWM